jgi:hypothetical protein
MRDHGAHGASSPLEDHPPAASIRRVLIQPFSPEKSDAITPGLPAVLLAVLSNGRGATGLNRRPEQS